MKKALAIVSVALMLIGGISSCKKIISKIFNGIDVTAPDVSITIPAVPFVLPNEGTLGTQTTKFNLDSTIRANTGGLFDISYVKSIKIKKITINLPDGDAANNLSNFQYARVTLASNTNTTVTEILNFPLPDVATNTATIPLTNSPELISYLKGSELYYTMYGKNRRITTKPLTFVVTVVVRVE